MNIYKLKYTDKEAAIIDLIKKGVYIELEDLNKLKYLNYGDGIKAVVELGLIVLVNGTLDDELKPVDPVYADGYHFDVMSEKEINFGVNEIIVNNPKHTFAGY
jgi:hypothetical protein